MNQMTNDVDLRIRSEPISVEELAAARNRLPKTVKRWLREANVKLDDDDLIPIDVARRLGPQGAITSSTAPAAYNSPVGKGGEPGGRATPKTKRDKVVAKAEAAMMRRRIIWKKLRDDGQDDIDILSEISWRQCRKEGE